LICETDFIIARGKKGRKGGEKGFIISVMPTSKKKKNGRVGKKKKNSGLSFLRLEEGGRRREGTKTP